MIYPIELEIKDTTDTARSDSYRGILIEIGNEGRSEKDFSTKYDFNFYIVSLPFINSNISAALAYVVYMYISVDATF